MMEDKSNQVTETGVIGGNIEMSRTMTMKEKENRLAELKEFNEFEAKLVMFKASNTGADFDLSVVERYKQAKDDHDAISEIIRDIDTKHEEVQWLLREKMRLVDKERNRIKDQLLDIQREIKNKIDSHEQRNSKKMMKFRKNPASLIIIPSIIDAMQYDGTNVWQIVTLDETIFRLCEDGIQIRTPNGEGIAYKNDWIIKGAEGVFYPCRPNIFEQIYSPMESSDEPA